MANIQFDNVEVVDAMYNAGCDINGKPTLQLTMTFDDRLSDSERTKLKKLLYSQNESPDIKMAIGLQTYIPGAWTRKTPKELANEAKEILKQEVPLPGYSGRYPLDSTDRIDSISKAYESIVRALAIDHIFYDDIATVVFWKDGTKTIVKCPEGTPYDEYTAFCVAVTKKFYGTNSAIKRVIKKKARYSKKRQVIKTVCREYSVREGNTFYPYKANRIVGKVTSVKETDNGLEVEVIKND